MDPADELGPQRWDPAEVLRVLLAEEAKGRDIATRELRRRQVTFPSGKSFQSWREQDSSISPATQRALKTLEWIERAENLALAAPSGTGKSHFLEALGHTAIDAGLKVSWFTLETLTQTINRSKIDASTAKVVQRIGRISSWSTTSACSRPASPRPLPHRGHGLRAAQPRGHLQHSPVRLRHPHAQGARFTDGRSAASSRSCRRHRR
jgi:hypothetical protein